MREDIGHEQVEVAHPAQNAIANAFVAAEAIIVIQLWS